MFVGHGVWDAELKSRFGDEVLGKGAVFVVCPVTAVPFILAYTYTYTHARKYIFIHICTHVRVCLCVCLCMLETYLPLTNPAIRSPSRKPTTPRPTAATTPAYSQPTVDPGSAAP